MVIDRNYIITFLLHSHDQTLPLVRQHFVYICCWSCVINQTIKRYQTLRHFCESLYLAETRDYGITYSAKPTHLQDKDLFFGYADAGFNNNQSEGQSTSRYVFILYDRAITWGSQKQNIVQLPSQLLKPSISCFPKRAMRLCGSSIYIKNLASIKGLFFWWEIIKGQLA